MAKSSQSGANYGMKLDLSDAIAKLKALQDEMKKTFGTAGEGGTVTMKLGLDVSGAKQALKDLVAKPLTVKININPGDVKSQIQKAIGSLTVSPMADRTNQLFSDQPKIQRAIQQGSGSSYRPGTSIVPYESFRPYERLIENAFRATVPPSYDAGGNRVYSDAMIEVYKQQSRAMNVVPNSGYTYWESAYRGNISAARNARYTPNWSQDFASTSREIQAASAYAKTHHEAPYQYQQRYTPNWQAANYYNGSGWYDYTSKLFGNMSDQKPFQKWEMTNIPGYAKPWEQQRGSGVNPFGLYMFSSAMSSVANKLDSMFGKVEESYDTSALSFRKTQLVSGMGSDQFESYKNSLLDLAGETMTHVPTLAEMGYSFATRGYMNPETASDVLRPLAISGLITGEDPVTMSKSVMSLAQAWNPMSLTSLTREAPRIVGEFADMTTYSYANSPLETRWFKDIANYAAPVFAGLGFDPTETLSTFMAMSQMIPTPGIGARSSRMALSNLFDVNKLTSVSEKYGIDMLGEIEAIRDAGGGIAEVLTMVKNQIESLPEMQRNAFTREIGGGVRGGMAFQALLPVIENISEYQREMEANAFGYTMRKQYDYAGTPYGQLQSAEAEREAIMYGTGEKTVGIRTSIMKLENTILKLIQKLPEGVLAAGYAAGKGFEGVAELTSGFANLAILKALAPKIGTMFGAAGAILTPAMFIGPLVAGLAGAIADGIQRGDMEEAKRTAERTEDLNLFEAAYELRDNFESPGSLAAAQGRLRDQYKSGEITYEEYRKKRANMAGDNVWDRLGTYFTGQLNPYVVAGKSVGDKEITALFKQADDYLKGSVPRVAAMMPGTEEEKEALQNKLEEYGTIFRGDLSDFTPEYFSRTLNKDLEATGRKFGEMDAEATPAEQFEQRRKNIEDFIAKTEFPTMPDLGDKYDWSLQGLLVDAYSRQTDPSWAYSDDDRLKLSKSEAEGYMKETFGVRNMGMYYGDETLDAYIASFGEVVGIINSMDEKIGITTEVLSEINDNVKEINSPMDATYGELFDAWTSGFLGTDTLPGMGDFAPLSLGYDSKDFAGTVIPAFNFAKQGSWANSGSGFWPVIDEDYTPSNKGRKWQGPGAYDIENILGTFNDAAGSLDKASIHINEGGIHTLTC